MGEGIYYITQYLLIKVQREERMDEALLFKTKNIRQSVHSIRFRPN